MAGIFRSKVLDQAARPDRLDSYIKVSNPSVWLLLGAIVAFPLGVGAWCVFGNITDVQPGLLRVQNGSAPGTSCNPSSLYTASYKSVPSRRAWRQAGPARREGRGAWRLGARRRARPRPRQEDWPRQPRLPAGRDRGVGARGAAPRGTCRLRLGTIKPFWRETCPVGGSMPNASSHGPTPARAALREALTSLMLEKPLARIGVKELCAAAHVSRSTFYAYYENTDALLREVELAHLARIATMNEAVSDPGVLTPDDMRFYDATVEYVRKNERDFRALLIADPDARFIADWKSEIKAHLRRRRATAKAAPLSALTEEVAASAVVSALACYLQDPGAVTPDDVHAILSKALAALDS